MGVEFPLELLHRAAMHAALADPARLAIVDALSLADLTCRVTRLAPVVQPTEKDSHD